MSNHDSTAPAARGGVTILCFLTILLGQGYLLRNILFSADFFSLPLPYYTEMFFCLLLAAGIIICFLRPLGWGSRLGCGIALALFVLYAAASVYSYDLFAAGYLTGFSAQFSSAGGALVGLKLVLALIGITAGIPVAPRMDDREYARRLREKVQMQDAEWAKATVKGARKDLETTLNKLKTTLSEEEMAELLAHLQDTSASSSKTASERSADEPEESPAEHWRGWGGGM